MASDDFDIVIEAMLEAPYKKEEVSSETLKRSLSVCCLWKGSESTLGNIPLEFRVGYI